MPEEFFLCECETVHRPNMNIIILIAVMLFIAVYADLDICRRLFVIAPKPEVIIALETYHQIFFALTRH